VIKTIARLDALIHSHVHDQASAAEESHGAQESGLVLGLKEGADVPADNSYGGGTGQGAGGAGPWPPLSQDDASRAAGQGQVPEVPEESIEEAGGEAAALGA